MYLASSNTSHGTNGFPFTMDNLKIERFVGEGIRLPCIFTYKIPRSERLLMSISEIRTTQRISIFPFFTKDNAVISNSSKQSVHISVNDEDNDLIKYHIYLDIYALETVNFGLYRGGLKFVFHSDCRCIHKKVQVTELYMCAFNITEVTEYYHYIDAPVGSLLTFKDLFLRGVPNEDSLHIEHFVNGISFNDSDTSVKCCLSSAKVFKDGRDLTISKVSSLSFELSDIYEIGGEICICSTMYGIHRFKLYRYNFNQKYNLRKTLEFWHPHITVVYPKSSNWIWGTISDKESDIMDKSKRDKNFSLFNGETFQYLQSKMDLEHSIMKYFETCLYIGTACALMVSLLYIWGHSMAFGDLLQRFLSEKLGIIVHLRLPDPGGNLADLGVRRYAIATFRQTFEFDVFLSYVEEDRRFVVEELISFLEEQNQRVCLNDENLPSGPLIRNFEQAVINSRKVIVVVSNSYTNNQMYNTFLLPTIILPRLYDGIIPSTHLMLLVCKTCMIPKQLLNDNRIVVIDYSKNPIHICQRLLHDWIHSS
ncbi:hypothetical protein ACJMK2_000649 [Sinanodonta woodiana]|uniref:TIR domain-containing protein n=1 Tax=Sinanodonta woodiana TaxID=1069815 RepID=A0ABD3XTF3_SINWO